MTLQTSSRIDCLILDLFGVVVSFEDQLVYDRLSVHCSEPSNAALAMHDLVSSSDLICGRLSLQELHANLIAQHDLKLSVQDFEAIWLESYSEPMPGVRNLLRQLHGQCRLVLLSNVDLYYWPTILDSIPELKSFDALALSFEQGYAKPDRLAFDRAVELSRTQRDLFFYR